MHDARSIIDPIVKIDHIYIYIYFYRKDIITVRTWIEQGSIPDSWERLLLLNRWMHSIREQLGCSEPAPKAHANHHMNAFVLVNRMHLYDTLYVSILPTQIKQHEKLNDGRQMGPVSLFRACHGDLRRSERGEVPKSFLEGELTYLWQRQHL